MRKVEPMDRHRINIAVIEPSHIVYEGLSNLVLKSENRFYLFRINDLDEINSLNLKEKLNIVILNPVTLQNRLNSFIKLKQNNPEISWIALIYSYFDNETLNKFDDKLFITEPIHQITQKLSSLSNTQKDVADNNFTELTEREIDVLIQLVKGLSNKEIADVLNISIHTVMSHRKNITEKTGIKSLSGLTIYAISKNIIQLNSISL